MTKKGPYKVVSSKPIYKNPWITVKEDEVVRPDGEKGIFGTVDYGEGVTVVAVNERKEIYLIKEYYYILERYGLQTPSGGVEDGETPLDAAKKELEEETGMKAGKWIPLGVIDPFTMVVRSTQHLFLALDLGVGKKIEEEIEVKKVPFSKAEELIENGEITYAPSIIAVHRAKEYLVMNASWFIPQ